VPAIATFAVPCRDAGPHLRPLLESLLAQTRQDFDLLLVDDASTDGSAELARSIAGARVRVVRNERPLGLAGNFARCVELTATPFVCLAHQDDVYEPGYLEALFDALQARPDAAFAHCPARAIDADGRVVDSAAERHKVRRCARAANADRRALYALLFRGNFVCCPSVLFRTDALRAAGGFDARWHYALDWELWFRLLRASHSFATVTRPLLRYRRHDAAASRARTRDLSRFREEVEVLAQARELGVAAGLLDAGARSTAVRNNALHEACDDLHRGDRAAAAAKIAFVRALPGFSRDPWLCAFAAMARLGAPGRTALTAGRALAVRLGLGG
jgi:GT2 family glycosyltransferase